MVKVHYVIKKVPWAFFSLCTSKVINNNGPLLHSLIHFSKPMVNSSQWPCLKEVIVFPEILVGSCWSAAPFSFMEYQLIFRKLTLTFYAPIAQGGRIRFHSFFFFFSSQKGSKMIWKLNSAIFLKPQGSQRIQ